MGLVEIVMRGSVKNQFEGQMGGVQTEIIDKDLNSKFLLELGQPMDFYSDYFPFPMKPPSYIALNLVRICSFHSCIHEWFTLI